jgi:hypothetical protein
VAKSLSIKAGVLALSLIAVEALVLQRLIDRFLKGSEPLKITDLRDDLGRSEQEVRDALSNLYNAGFIAGDFDARTASTVQIGSITLGVSSVQNQLTVQDREEPTRIARVGVGNGPWVDMREIDGEEYEGTLSVAGEAFELSVVRKSDDHTLITGQPFDSRDEAWAFFDALVKTDEGVAPSNLVDTQRDHGDEHVPSEEEVAAEEARTKAEVAEVIPPATPQGSPQDAAPKGRRSRKAS